MAQKGIVSGPYRKVVWGGINITPEMGSSPKEELGDYDFEVKKGGNGDIYSEAKPVIQSTEFDITISTTDYVALVALKDGVSRSGTITKANGDVLILDCIIDGELKNDNGKATLKLSGSITKQ